MLEKLRRARAGDARAREELVEENMPLVHYVLRRFRDRSADYEDMFQYGCMGLLKAIDRFDPSVGTRFSTYAVPVILGEVRRFLRDDAPVHISRAMHDTAQHIDRFREAFLRDNAREPTVDEISAGMGLSREYAVLALNARRDMRSLYEPVNGDGELRLMDVIGEETMGDVDRRLLVAGLMKELTPQERTIIVLRYYRSNTQSEIAQIMGVSQVQVSRLERKILKRMRARAEGE